MTQILTEQAIEPAVRAWTRLLRAYALTTRLLSAELQEAHGLTINDFEVSYLAGTFKGHFNEIAAELAVDDERATLEGTTKVASIDVNEENLSAHLQSPDFFDAEQYPELRFTAEDIRLDGDGQVSVDGDLTIKGITQPVTVTGTVTAPMSDPYGTERIGLNLTTKVDRTNFGINWNNPLPSGEPSLANDVTILAELQFVKQGES